MCVYTMRHAHYLWPLELIDYKCVCVWGGGCVKPGVGVGGLLLWQGVGYSEMESRVPVSWRRLWSN